MRALPIMALWAAFATVEGAAVLRAPLRPYPPARSACRPPAQIAASSLFEEVSGCQVLRPQGKPKAFVHFLGGVFASPSPHVLYRHLLQQLAARGYVVVANPYEVDFDYLQTADGILDRFQSAVAAVRPEAAREGIPLFAVGHSLGALMHTVIGSLFAESMPSYAGAALLSHNNKQLRDAVPAFETVVAPSLAPYADLSRLPSYKTFLQSAQALRRSTIALARDVVGNSPSTADYVSILDDVAEIASLVDQVPRVLAGIAEGTREFSPTPDELRRALRSSYAVPRSLIVSFYQDDLDESDSLEAALLGKAGVERKRLTGTHLTPLAPDPNVPLAAVRQQMPSVPQLDVLMSQVQKTALRDLEALVDTLDEWAERVAAEVHTANS